MGKGKTGSPGLPPTAFAPAGQKARNAPDPVLCLSIIRVAGGAKAMEKQQSVLNNRTVWANVAKDRKSNPFIDKVWNSVARGFVQQEFMPSAAAHGIKCFNISHKKLTLASLL